MGNALECCTQLITDDVDDLRSDSESLKHLLQNQTSDNQHQSITNTVCVDQQPYNTDHAENEEDIPPSYALPNPTIDEELSSDIDSETEGDGTPIEIDHDMISSNDEYEFDTKEDNDLKMAELVQGTIMNDNGQTIAFSAEQMAKQERLDTLKRQLSDAADTLQQQKNEQKMLQMENQSLKEEQMRLNGFFAVETMSYTESPNISRTHNHISKLCEEIWRSEPDLIFAETDDQYLYDLLMHEILRNEINDADDEKMDSNSDEKEMDNRNHNNSKIMIKNKYELKLKQLKEHKKYKEMSEQNNALTDAELLSLIYYTDSNTMCIDMRLDMYDDKWRELYYNLTNGVIKLHQVFHLKNDNQENISYLYHGDSMKNLNEHEQDKLFLTTVFSLTTDFDVADKFGTGSIFIIADVYDGINSGTLEGADVSWISMRQEIEWIVTPTTMYRFQEMNDKEIKERDLVVSGQKDVYITKQYITRNNTHSRMPSMIPEYSIQSSKAIDKDVKLFMKGVGFKRKQDQDKYVELFISNGYEDLEDIATMTEDDLEEIGITKKGHRRKLLRALGNINTRLDISPLISIQSSQTADLDIHSVDNENDNDEINRARHVRWAD